MKAEAFVEANDLKKVTIIKQSKHQEQQKVSTRAIRYILKKLKDRAVMKVEVTQNGDLVELTCKTDGERERVCVCVEEHAVKFIFEPLRPKVQMILVRIC